MASAPKFFPPRNLGEADAWGVAAEEALRAELHSGPVDEQGAAGLNRYTASTFEGIAARAVEVEAALRRVPHSFAAATGASGFGLSPGWNTVATHRLAVPAGKNRLAISAFGLAIGRKLPSIIDNGGTTRVFEWPFDPRSQAAGGTVPVQGGEFGDRSQWGFPYHNGIDFSGGEAYSGAPVPVMADGQVLLVHGWGGGTGGMDALGNYIRVDHGYIGGHHLMTGYAHFKSYPLIAEGAFIERGETLGYIGTTGFSTGNHLHMETWEDGTRIDPRIFMERYGYASTGPVIEPGATATHSRILIPGVASPSFYFMLDSFTHRPIAGGVTSVAGQSEVEVSLQLLVGSEAVPPRAKNAAHLTMMGAFS